MKGPKLSRARQRSLREREKPKPIDDPRELTRDQQHCLVFLKTAHDANEMPTTAEVAAGLGWDLRRAVEVLRQVRALGFIAHDMDQPAREPGPGMLDVLKRFGLADYTREEMDALVLIEQGADRLPPQERAGFLIGCGLQELREQGYSNEFIRKTVLEFLDAGMDELRATEAPKGAPN